MLEDTYTPEILFIDDERNVLKAMTRLTREEPWIMHFAENGEEGLKIINERTIDVVVSDMRMPGMNGAEFLSHVRDCSPSTERVLLTGYSDIECIKQAVNEAKISNYLTKPWNDDALVDVIEKALEKQASERRRKVFETELKQKNVELGQTLLSLNKKFKSGAGKIREASLLLHHERKKSVNREFCLVSALARFFEHKSGEVDDTSLSISHMSEKVAVELRLPAEKIQNIRLAALLYNIGLAEKSMLESSKQDENIGEKICDILHRSPELVEVSKIVETQYQNLNGNDASDVNSDESIPLEAKIISVVGDYFNLIQGRIEKPMNIEEAIQYLEDYSGEKYDQQVVQVFLEKIIKRKPKKVFDGHVKPENLLPGSALEYDITTHTGAVLFKAGLTVTDSMICTIQTAREKLRFDANQQMAH